MKYSEIMSGFQDNFVWTCWGNFSQIWQEYMWSFVNVLKKCPKISDLTKTHVSQLNLFDINGNLARRCCLLDFSRACYPLTHSLPKGVLKQELSGIEVTTFFGLNNFRNISAMKTMFFFPKCSKFFGYFINAMKYSQNMSIYDDNIVWTFAGISLKHDKNTYDRPSTC